METTSQAGGAKDVAVLFLAEQSLPFEAENVNDCAPLRTEPFPHVLYEGFDKSD
jgi:hypothetical protein